VYFSDKEQGQKDRILEDITIDIWNGIVSVFEDFKNKNHFSENFPIKCDEYQEMVCGFDEELFKSRVKSEIPNIDIPIQIKQEESISWNFDKYTILDFIEFCYKNITEAEKDNNKYNQRHYQYYGHYHFKFKDSKKIKNIFIEEINKIFERNGIVFYLNSSGEINRTIAKAIEPLINKIYKTNDNRLNKLVKLSQDKFILPKIEDRIYALEKIWDAFERMKTYYMHKNKKQSIEELIQLVSKDSVDFANLLNDECKSLTDIGNNYQIRHFETNRIEIKDNKHIDYLYYRMISLIHLFLSELEN